MKSAVLGLKDRLASKARYGTMFGPRRNYAGVSWATAEELGQPQDGVADAREMSDSGTHRVVGRMNTIEEPEDAGLTGTTRSLGRRLLGLNVVDRPKPARPALLRQPALTRPVQAA